MARKKHLILVEDEAEEEQEEEEHQHSHVDDQVEISEGVYDGSNEEEDDEDEYDEDLDAYEDDGFVVDNVEEEEEEEEEDHDATGKLETRRRKRKSLNSCVLDDDDYELIQENGRNFSQQPNLDITKFKRLRKIEREPADLGASSTFSNDEGGCLEDEVEDDGECVILSGDEDDEMDDFIVNDEMAITAVENPTPISVCYERREQVAKKQKRKQVAKKQKRKQAVRVDSSLSKKVQVFDDGVNASKLPEQDEAAPLKANDTGNTDKKDDHAHIDIDVPERMTACEEIICECDPTGEKQSNFEEEGYWIFNQLNSNMSTLFRFDLVDQIEKEDIVSFLKLYQVEKYDIPFIAMYRKEQCHSLLKTIEQDGVENEDRLKWHKVLWAISELHRMWLLLQKRKSCLLQYHYKHNEEHVNHQLFESVITSLRNAQSENDVNDVEMKFTLHFPPVEIKRPKWRSYYDNCISAGLQNVAKKFGIHSEQFDSLFTLREANDSPTKVASIFTCSMFETPEAVLKGARHVAALEISSEPCIKSHVRSFFLEKALVSTRPTPRGEKIIDSLHPFAKVKWLYEKPILQFFDAQWFLIEKAEIEKLLQVTIKLSESSLNHLRSNFRDCYLGDGLHESGRLWNEQRRFILEDALSTYLLPCMEKEARKFLTVTAKKWLVMEYGKQLWAKVSVAPYKHKENNVVALNVETAPRVMACCWGPGKPETTCVILDSTGEVLEVLHVGYLSSRSQNAIDQQHRRNDQDCFLKILRNHQPHVVVIGAENAFCTQLKDDISELIRQTIENAGDDGQAMLKIDIVYGDVSLPHLYEHSQISTEQLSAKPGIVKRAVALGRYLQNPLAMIATLCDSRREIVNWKLTSLDHFLSSDEKYEMLQQVMVDITNQVGFDINFALNHDWLFAPLQFISGLGPQKAAAMKKALVGAVELKNRSELVDYGLRAKHIYHNAVGFLCVRYGNVMEIDSTISVLDGTRVHPETYSLAEDFVKAVLRFHNQDDISSLHNLMANPIQLRDFVTYEHVVGYMKEKGENRIYTMYDVITELLHKFEDPRNGYKEPTEDEAFGMIVGDNKDLIAEGRVVQVTVRHVLAKRAICGLDVGLTGILSKDDFSDDGGKFDLKDKLHGGDRLTCKIKEIDKCKYMVFLSCKESKLKSKRAQDFHDVDPYYREDWSNVSTEKHFTPREIFHPKFQNVTRNEAVKFLADKGAGEYIFHPSPRGVYYLTLTVKVHDGVYAHKDMIEDEKDQTDLTDLLRLGSLLKLGDDEFGNLYEVMDRYIDPVVTHLKAMLSYKKFKTGSTSEVDNQLRDEKTDYHVGITYAFSISRKYPGNFVMSYIETADLHHEYVGLHPKGFKFRNNIFESIDQLVASFQNGFHSLQNDPPAKVSSVLKRVKPLGCGRGRNSISLGSHVQAPFNRGKNYNKNQAIGDPQMHVLPRPYTGHGCGSFNHKDTDRGQGVGYARGENLGYRGASGRGRGNDHSRGRGHKPFKNVFSKSEDNTERWPSEFKGNGGLIKGHNVFSSVEFQNEPSRLGNGNEEFVASDGSIGGWSNTNSREGKHTGIGLRNGAGGRGSGHNGAANRGGHVVRGRGRGGRFNMDRASRGAWSGRGRGNGGRDSGFGVRGRGQASGSGRASRGGRGRASFGGRGRASSGG